MGGVGVGVGGGGGGVEREDPDKQTNQIYRYNLPNVKVFSLKFFGHLESVRPFTE